MRWSRSLIVVALLALSGATAQAFQESVPEEMASPDANASASSTEQGTSLGLSPGEMEADEPSVPGISGLDFGLELLYGSKPPAASSAPPDDDDVGVRLKHTF